MLPPMPIILQAVEEVESHGKWWLVSKSGCVGVMQICPKYSKEKRAALFDPEVNRREGARMLAYWMQRTGNNLTRALAAYNCGNNGVTGKCGVGYANHVISLARKLNKTKPEPIM